MLEKSEAPILLYHAFMKQRYGDCLFRIPVDLGAGCPHRAVNGSGGCTFCPGHGARSVQTTDRTGDEHQVADAIAFARRRYGAKRFMLYFQAYTPTYNLDAQQRERIRRVIALHSFDAVTIGARPDCLPPAALDFLVDLAREREVWIELGVQTTHDRTLSRIHRGHNWACSERAIRALHERGLQVAAHLILGLPGETQADMITTAQRLAPLPLGAVKLHNLHVIRGTALAAEFEQTPFPLPAPMEYAEWVMHVLRHIPPHWAIIRMTTDTPPEDLIAPHWTMSKGRFIEHVQRHMILREWRQGDCCQPHPAHHECTEAPAPVVTDDGSITFFNTAFKEHYHTPAGALLEAENKYVAPSALQQRLANGPVRLLDICFGLGYNALCAASLAEKLQLGPLEIVALEIDRRIIRHAAHHISSPPQAPFDWKSWLHNLHAEKRARGKHAAIDLQLGDARHLAAKLPPSSFDIIFLDPFSTQRNSELWTLDFLRLLRRLIRQDGLLVTYCAALPVRGGMIQAAFHIGETTPVGRERAGTIASPSSNLISQPVKEDEMSLLLHSKRGLPYRDPDLILTNSEILRNRQMSLHHDQEKAQ